MFQRIVNLTPHAVRLYAADGVTLRQEIPGPPKGGEARVTEVPGRQDGEFLGVAVFSPPTVGEVINLPPPEEGTYYRVSAVVAAAPTVKGRPDVLRPGTGPNDNCVRNEAGHVVGVTRLIRA